MTSVPTLRTRTLVVAVMLVSGGLVACDEHATAKSKEADAGAAKTQAVPVQAQAVSVDSIAQTILATANVTARYEAHIIAETTGTVDKVLVEEGQEVKKDELLAQIKNPEAGIAVSTAAANVSKLRRELASIAPLVEKGFVSKQSKDELEHQLKQANDQLARVRSQADHLRVRSPLDGVVATRGIDPGKQVTPQTELFYVVDPSAVEAVIHVPERSLGKLAEGSDAYVVSDALGGAKFGGKIRLISPVVDPQTGTVKVTVELEETSAEGARLRPGMFVSVHLIIARRDSAKLLPKRAVVYEDNTPFVFAVIGEKDARTASKRAVKLGFEQDERVEVIDGVGAEDLVIVIGHSGLKDGTLVEVTSTL